MGVTSDGYDMMLLSWSNSRLLLGFAINSLLFAVRPDYLQLLAATGQHLQSVPLLQSDDPSGLIMAAAPPSQLALQAPPRLLHLLVVRQDVCRRREMREGRYPGRIKAS